MRGNLFQKERQFLHIFYETHKGKNRFHKRHRAQKIRCIQGISCRARGDNEAQVARIRKGRARHRVRQGSPRLDYEPSRKMADFLPQKIVFAQPACFALIYAQQLLQHCGSFFYLCRRFLFVSGKYCCNPTNLRSCNTSNLFCA